MKAVYIETSVLSYLTARPSRDLLAAAHQQVTQTWWEERRSCFEVFISPLVEQECRRGDPEAARRRLAAIRELPELQVIEEAYDIAAALIAEGAIPQQAEDDAMHVALAAVHGIDYLLTWNCRHIDNAETKPVVRLVCATHGYECPEICTPEELMGDQDED